MKDKKLTEEQHRTLMHIFKILIPLRVSINEDYYSMETIEFDGDSIFASNLENGNQSDCFVIFSFRNENLLDDNDDIMSCFPIEDYSFFYDDKGYFDYDKFEESEYWKEYYNGLIKHRSECICDWIDDERHYDFNEELIDFLNSYKFEIRKEKIRKLLFEV